MTRSVDFVQIPAAVFVPLTFYQLFEVHARGIIGLERLMLEANGFDFRSRHPQNRLVKLAKSYGVQKDSEVASISYRISIDLYRTFAPIKQTTTTMAFASLELAGRLLDDRLEDVESGRDYEKWKTSREEVMGKYLISTPSHITSIGH